MFFLNEKKKVISLGTCACMNNGFEKLKECDKVGVIGGVESP